MAKITALIHAGSDDALNLGRALDSLGVCDQVLVINHGSAKEVDEIARQHGATCIEGVPGVSPGVYLVNAKHDWLLCLRPCEALSDELSAALKSWKDADDHRETKAYSLAIRTGNSDKLNQETVETRLVNRKKLNWTGEIPDTDLSVPRLRGDLLSYCTQSPAST